MNNYNSLLDALNDLKRRGYTLDFNLKPSAVHCAALSLELHPEAFTIDECYRFEGASDPDENSIIYALSSLDGLKGTLTDAYGAYADSMSTAMIEKLKA